MGKIEKIIPLIKERIKTIKEACELISPFFYNVRFTEEINNFFANEKSIAANILNNAIAALETFKDSQISNDEPLNKEVNLITFESSLIESELKKIAAGLGINFRKVAEVVRIALWGAKVSPPLFRTIEILGRTETLNRLKTYSKNL